jgi:arylformamidase
MRFDYHPGDRDAPVIINIHGVYWRALDKSAMQHHMADLSRSGFSTANLNYPLCPEISLTEIVHSLQHALDKLVGRVMENTPYPKFILLGHSAGAHLSAHLSHHPRLQGKLAGVVALTGIYETEVVRHIAVNDDIRMTPQEAER